MQAYTKRLQVLLSPALWDRLQALARERRVSAGSLIREAVEQAYFPERPSISPLEAVQRLAAMNLPVADWEQMEAESTTEGCNAGLY